MLQEFAEREPGSAQPIDYDAEYRVLDLPPGAALPDIQDRARLLRAAFCPDDLLGSLQVHASERAMQITLAAERLTHYWRRHGAAPPGGRVARPDVAGPAAVRHMFNASAEDGSGPPAARPAPRLRLVAAPAQLRSDADHPPRAGAAQSAALRAAIASGRDPKRRVGRSRETPPRRPLAIAVSAFAKLMLAGLVVAAVVRVQHYRAEHPSLTAFSDPNAMIVTGMPIEPPVRWAGQPVPARQVIGAAAPAVAGRRRQQ